MKYIIKTAAEIVRLHSLIYVGLVTQDGTIFKPPYARGTLRYFDALDTSGCIAPVTQQMIDFSNSDLEGAAEVKDLMGDVFYTYQELIDGGQIIEES